MKGIAKGQRELFFGVLYSATRRRPRFALVFGLKHMDRRI